MKCNSVIKHNLKVCNKKCNPPQKAMDLFFIVAEIYLIVHIDS